MKDDRVDFDRFWSPVFDGMQDLVFLIDENFDLIRVNKRFIEFTGKKEKELVGKKCYTLIHGANEPFPGCPHQKALKSKVFEKGTFYEPRLEKWLSVNTTPFFDDDHKLAGSIHIVSDVTEYKKKDELLKLRNIAIESSISALSMTDVRGIIAYVNSSCVKMWGYDSAKEVIGRKLVEFWKQDGKSKLAIAALRKTGTWNGELKAIRKDGSLIDVHVLATVVKDDDGRPVALFGSFADITERKEAEEALKESEARYRALFAGAAEGLIVADLKTKKFRHANPTVCRMFGYTEEEFTRLGVSDIHPKESLDHVMSEFKAQARGKKVLAPELPCIRKDGTLFYADVSAASIVLDGHECNVGFFTDVTERKRAQDEIQATKDYASNIIKSMIDMLVVIGPDARIRTVNKAAVVLSGYEEDELIGKPVGILFAEEEEEEEKATFKGRKFKKLLKKGFIAGYEMILTTKAGARVPVSFSGSVMKDRGSRLMGIVGIARDMREKREVEDALLELGEKYRTVVENAADCVYLLDTMGRFIHANKKALELSEIKDPESIVGKNFTNFVVARYKETAAQHIKKALAGETVQLHYETTMPKKKRRWWGATLVPLKDMKGRVVNILNISRDLTLERESKARIEFFREYAENVLANVPISVLVVNRAGNVVFANRNFIVKMRRAEKDIIGQNISEIMPSEIMVKAGWQAQIAEVLRTRDIVMGQKFEYRGKTFNYHMVPMREAVGRRHNVAIVMEDITERISLEAQLQHSEKLAMMGQFTAGVAHEINNPLSIIKGNVQYLREQIRTGVDFQNKSDFRELKDTLVAVEQETVRCGDIITDLLHFAKKSGGKRKTLVDVNHVVRHVLHLMGRQLDLKDIKVERELKQRIAMVRGNHDLLQQVVMNLVINAEQAVTKRGIINIKTLQNAKKVYIVVKDNGRGIPKELMGFIFNPFFTTKDVEKGTGLGLSVAHAIVEDHNGTITVRSSPKRGSVFTIELPVAKGGN